MKDDIFWAGFGLFLLALFVCSCATAMNAAGVKTYYGNTTLAMYDPIDNRVTVVHVSNDGGL